MIPRSLRRSAERSKFDLVVLDLSLARGGGGLRVAAGAVEASQALCHDFDFLYVLPSEPARTVLLTHIADSGRVIAAAPKNRALRVLFHLSLRRILHRHRPDLVYSPFGVAIVRPLRSIPYVAGMAYSNLIVRRRGFWSGVGLPTLIMRLVRDRFRKSLLRNATMLTVETPYLKEQLAERLRVSPERILVLPPSFSTFPYEPRGPERNTDSGRFVVLLLASDHPNKQARALGPLAAKIEEVAPLSRVELRVSLPADSPLVKSILREAGAGNYRVKGLGLIPSEDVAAVYRSAKVVLLISRLESFSNTCLEAWACGVPLIAARSEWAHASCADAALYADVEPEDLAKAILQLERDLTRWSQLREAGYRRLGELPTARDRLEAVLAFGLKDGTAGSLYRPETGAGGREGS